MESLGIYAPSAADLKRAFQTYVRLAHYSSKDEGISAIEYLKLFLKEHYGVERSEDLSADQRGEFYLQLTDFNYGFVSGELDRTGVLLLPAPGGSRVA